MKTDRKDEVKDIALKLDAIRSRSPEDYFYIKGWIHCLYQKENRTGISHGKPPKQTV